MLGGSISRYHTPQLGNGMAEDLIKVAGPVVGGALQRGAEGVRRGKQAKDAFTQEAARLNLKRKASAVRQKVYKRRRVPDIFG